MIRKVEIQRVRGSEDVVRKILQTQGYSLDPAEPGSSGFLLNHPKYAAEMSDVSVHSDAMSLAARLERASAIEPGDLGIEVGDVLVWNDEGRMNRHMFMSVRAEARLEARGTGTVTKGPGPTEGERELRAAKQRAQEAARVAAQVRRVSEALANPDVLKLRQLLQGRDHSYGVLWKIWELCDKRLCPRVTLTPTEKAELERFKRTVNGPELSGDEARHAVQDADKLHPDPMNSDQARDYALRLARACLEKFGGLP